MSSYQQFAFYLAINRKNEMIKLFLDTFTKPSFSCSQWTPAAVPVHRFKAKFRTFSEDTEDAFKVHYSQTFQRQECAVPGGQFNKEKYFFIVFRELSVSEAPLL